MFPFSRYHMHRKHAFANEDNCSTEGVMARGNRLILDRYELVGTAGSGGFGTVQIAWDPRIQRKVAIKTIQLSELDAYRANLPGARAVSASPTADRWHGAMPWNEYLESDGEGFGYRPSGEYGPDDDFDSPDQVISLSHLPGLDEARTAAMLQDPRIVTVYDFEIRDRTAYLIMEYVEGITLTRLLADYPDFLTLDMVAAVFDAMAGALTVAHKAGVLHLDIKPDNIIINPQGQAKVTDFGLATLADASGAGTTGGGTIGYMPLEQMRREHLDARTDEWSLAAVAYEMLTGDNPFRADDLDQAEAAIEDAELILPSLCWDNLDEQVDDVVFYALDPDREERYASVADFAEEMDKFLGDSAKGRGQLELVVADALGLLADDADDEGEWEDDAVEAPKTPGFFARLFSSGQRGVPDGGVDDGQAEFAEYDEPAFEDEPPARPRRSHGEKRKARTEEQLRRRRAVLGRIVAALVGGLATWFALGNLPPVPDVFGLNPGFFNIVVSLVMAAVSAIVPKAGLPIVAVLLVVSFIPRFL